MLVNRTRGGMTASVMQASVQTRRKQNKEWKWKWKWNLTEVTSHDEAGSALRKKTADHLQHGPLSARGELESALAG